MYPQPQGGTPQDEARQRLSYLQRFADREGRTFLAGFYSKYRNKSSEQRLELLMARAHGSPRRLAAIYRSVNPQAEQEEFDTFIRQQYRGKQPDAASLQSLYQQFAPGRFSLTDQGYVAGVHPLELWLVGYLQQKPNAGWSELVSASSRQRQEVYQWLFSSRNSAGQASRIRQMREIDAFDRILKQWQQLGYPFDSMVPSYASALGASADRPAALAELMGILVNDGKRLATIYLDKLHFAASTPYETVLQQRAPQGVQVLSPEVPQAVRKVLAEVVEQGTARRVNGAFDQADGRHITIGGKTGTGDNRYKTFAKGGALLSERVVSRSGAFAFYIGDRYFGTLTAYVAGPQAADYKFTSALPVQVLKELSPVLKRRLQFDAPLAPAVPPTLAAAPVAKPAASLQASAPLAVRPQASAPVASRPRAKASSSAPGSSRPVAKPISSAPAADKPDGKAADKPAASQLQSAAPASG